MPAMTSCSVDGSFFFKKKLSNNFFLQSLLSSVELEAGLLLDERDF
jgi:hypothetical protein